MKQLKKLTYDLKKKLSKMGKNVEDYKIKTQVSANEYLLINTRTHEELLVS